MRRKLNLNILLWVLVWVSGAMPTTLAKTLTPFQQTTEVMMDAQGMNAIFVAAMFGVDSAAVLSFTSQVAQQPKLSHTRQIPALLTWAAISL